MGLGQISGRCVRKIYYQTKAEATAALKRMRARGFACIGQQAYTCALCGGAHVGMARKRAKAEGR